jgi:hypothetical protein
MRQCELYKVMPKEDREWERRPRDRLRPDEKKALLRRNNDLQAKITVCPPLLSSSSFHQTNVLLIHPITKQYRN